MIDGLRHQPGKPLVLARHPTDSVVGAGPMDRASVERETAALLDRMKVLQARLAAEGERGVILVLQGMDASGKDGTIRRVFSGVNPQGVVVHSFKAPTEDDRAHDYLRRVHARLPRRGEIGVLNRSHYEDVVAAPVRGLVSDEVVRRRLRHIREFERMLTDEGFVMLKVFLHVSRVEQGRRLRVRLEDPEAHWKFQMSDIDDRRRWEEFERAYERALSETASDRAPWWIVPADRKWLRDRCVMQIVVDALAKLDPRPPRAQVDPGIVIDEL
jgi:PPK2 family polyphosphate:nucleotide phosphotransferase